jgi:hypothetical protein
MRRYRCKAEKPHQKAHDPVWHAYFKVPKSAIPRYQEIQQGILLKKCTSHLKYLGKDSLKCKTDGRAEGEERHDLP